MGWYGLCPQENTAQAEEVYIRRMKDQMKEMREKEMQSESKWLGIYTHTYT